MIEYIAGQTRSKKMIAVGNPPYHEEDSGHGRSSKALYNILIEVLIDSQKVNQILMVIPARWFSGGKGLDRFRSKMLQEGQVQRIKYFENPHDVFPTVEIRGGVCFLHWNDEFKEKLKIDDGAHVSEFDSSCYDIIVPHAKAHSILEKVLKKHGANRFLDHVVWPRKPFGLEGNYFSRQRHDHYHAHVHAHTHDHAYNRSHYGTHPGNHHSNHSHHQNHQVECFCRGKKIESISKNLIPNNTHKIDEYKVAFPEASGGGKGQRHKVLPKPTQFFILKKNQISTETYSIAHSFGTLKEANNFLGFLQTYFSRFLLGLRKPTQHTSRKTFAWVPLMDTKVLWTDEMLFEHFGIAKKEQSYIKEKVDNWTA